MAKDEALKLALEALESSRVFVTTREKIKHPEGTEWYDQAITAIKEALAQPEQEPVAMKFKIYKPTVPDPPRQDINNALLPWVYDQDRSSGFDATMWVTPVATLPPQRKPLTDGEINLLAKAYSTMEGELNAPAFARAILRKASK